MLFFCRDMTFLVGHVFWLHDYVQLSSAFTTELFISIGYAFAVQADEIRGKIGFTSDLPGYPPGVCTYPEDP